MTVEEYLAFEETAEVKHELADGFVFAVAGLEHLLDKRADVIFW